jgi:hypothetical protein
MRMMASSAAASCEPALQVVIARQALVLDGAAHRFADGAEHFRSPHP